MAQSFSVERRFFDDKNYPRGFSRHGDYTIKESETLEQYGQAFKALDSGERRPVTDEEEAFVAFCKGERPAEINRKRLEISSLLFFLKNRPHFK